VIFFNLSNKEQLLILLKRYVKNIIKIPLTKETQFFQTKIAATKNFRFK